MDMLLKKMGISNLDTAQVNEMKAPMPGLILDILVETGQEVKKGDQLLILEAMKMESPTSSKNLYLVYPIKSIRWGRVFLKF